MALPLLRRHCFQLPLITWPLDTLLPPCCFAVRYAVALPCDTHYVFLLFTFALTHSADTISPYMVIDIFHTRYFIAPSCGAPSYDAPSSLYCCAAAAGFVTLRFRCHASLRRFDTIFRYIDATLAFASASGLLSLCQPLPLPLQNRTLADTTRVMPYLSAIDRRSLPPPPLLPPPHQIPFLPPARATPCR